MANSVLCTKCENWVHGKCRLAMHFVGSKCKGIMEGTVDLIEKLCDEVETVYRFCYLGDRLNASGGCQPAITARIWVVFTKLKSLSGRSSSNAAQLKRV